MPGADFAERATATLRMSATDVGAVLRHGPEAFEAITATRAFFFANRGPRLA
jgi:hypothetical protein